MSTRDIPCPICRKPIVAEFEPFCSKRCSHVDLSRWLKGSYVIAGEDAADEDVAERPAPGPDED